MAKKLTNIEKYQFSKFREHGKDGRTEREVTSLENVHVEVVSILMTSVCLAKNLLFSSIQFG